MIEKSKSKQDNFFSLCNFGCRVYVQPLGNIKSKFKNHASKWIFLGYDPNTTQNVIYCDVDTHRIKLASHVRFDEGMNKFPMVDATLNFQHL